MSQLVPFIQARIDAVAKHNPHYQRREGQIKIIGAIYKTFAKISPEKHLAVDAPVGIGKSIGYLTAAAGKILHDKIHNKKEEKPTKIIIATSTVTLQQQLTHKDIPEVIKDTTLNVAMVAGRGRYFCKRRADNVLQAHHNYSLLDDTPDDQLDNATINQIQGLYKDVEQEHWSGLKDDLPANKSIQARHWRVVNAEANQCNSTCQHYKNCPFIRSRHRLSEADIIVTNHSMVFADLQHNHILPPPEETIYVFDEAHNMKNVYRDQGAGRVNLEKLINLCRQGALIEGQYRQAMILLKHPTKDPAQGLSQSLSVLANDATQVNNMIRLLGDDYFDQASSFDKNKGVINLSSDGIAAEIIEAYRHHLKISLNRVNKTLDKGVEYYRSKKSDAPEIVTLMAELMGVYDYLDDAAHTLEQFFIAGNDFHMAKWLQRLGKADASSAPFAIQTCPVDISDSIKAQLFDRAKHVILTSGTMKPMESFDRTLVPLGLGADDVRVCSVESPFDFKTQAEMILHNDMVKASFKFEAQHTEQVDTRVRATFFDDPNATSGLLLFASKRQMWTWFKKQRPNDRNIIQLQSTDIERHALVNQHKLRIDNGQKSLLVGLQSLAEGLDLPREYLTWLGIAKIPFSDPFGNVVEACEAELVKASGGDPFQHISLPEASSKLIQNVGRGIRTMDDTCTIHIFDSRMNQRWAKGLLKSLPPIPIEQYKAS